MNFLKLLIIFMSLQNIHSKLVFELQMHRITVDSVNKKFYNYLNMTETFLNRKTRSFDIKTELNSKVDDTYFVLIALSVLRNNKYVRLPILDQKLSICKLMKSNVFGISNMLEKNGFPKSCPIPKGVYEIKNASLDGKHSIPMPEGDYKIVFSISCVNEIMSRFTWFGSLKKVYE